MVAKQPIFTDSLDGSIMGDKGTQNGHKRIFEKQYYIRHAPTKHHETACVDVLKNTYSFQNPLTDVEYADDTQDTLSRLHLRQHLAARFGLLYGPKRQLLCIHVSLPISLSTKDPYSE